MYPCNITFIYTTVSTEYASVCDFANYHMFMFVMCVSVSAVLLSISVASILYYGSNATPQQIDSIERCTRWAMVMLLLSLGVDGAFIVFYFTCFILVFGTTTYVCFQSFQQGMVAITRDMVARITRTVCRSSNLVAISGESNIHVVVLNTSCPICLETDDGPWYTTPCGHVFHPNCIGQWQRATCPLCRAVVEIRRR